MIGHYTKKPVNIEAIKYTGKYNQQEIVDYCTEKAFQTTSNKGVRR